MTRERTRCSRFGSAPTSVYYRKIRTLRRRSHIDLYSIATGMSGTAVFRLSIRDASLIILFFSMTGAAPVAYLGTLGPKTGLRQMVQARYSYGLYLASVVVLFQLATLTGYCIIITIVSGQTLAALSHGSLSIELGIVIIAILGLLVSFMGYRVLHVFETYCWIPTLIALVATLGISGQKLSLQAQTTIPTARTAITFGSIIFSLAISWAAVVSDFAVYISPTVSRKRTFAFVYLGYNIPSILLLVLGAAMGGCIANISSWSDANDTYSVGGVIYVMASPAGRFGQFVAALLALSVVGLTANTLYALSVSLPALIPLTFLTRVPRYLYSVIITGIAVGVSIPAASSFYASLSNFLGIIGYWTAVYVGIALTEFIVLRKGNSDSYDHAIWNSAKALPFGAAAIVASVLSFGMIIPCMDAVWYVGPIAKHTGDLGIEMGLCLSVFLYLPLRKLEMRRFER